MKVTVRTLQQKTFEVEAEPQHTVLNIKQKLGSLQGEAPEHLKLFYAGRTLSDDQKSVESLNLRDNSYLVVMVTKPRATEFEPGSISTGTSTPTTTGPTPTIPLAAATGSTGFSSAFTHSLPTFPRSEFTAPKLPTNPVASASSGVLSHSPAPKPTETKPAATPQSSISDNNDEWTPGPSTFEATEVEDSVKALIDMGFERDEVLKALKASFGNTDRAVEYLTSGIPEGLDDESSVFSSNPFSSSNSSFRPFGASSNPFSSSPFSSGGPSSAFRPFDTSSSWPRPREMVGHIEEVDPDQPEEEPSKPAEPESVPASQMKDVPTPSNDSAPTSSTQPVIATPHSPTPPPPPTPPVIPESSPSVFSGLAAPTPNFTPTPSRPLDFSELSPFGGNGSGSGEENVTLESLRDDPMVQQMRELVGQNPELIGPLFEQLVQSRPQIMGLLSSNPEAVAMLFVPGASLPRAEPQSHSIAVTGEEKASLDRLESMGFSRAAVVQAYFAFDKNEELAANYLIENCEED